MKKALSLTILSMFMLIGVSSARTIYNPDNTIQKSSTIRGQKKYNEQRMIAKKEAAQAAAAAKIDYQKALANYKNLK